ncbi:hypothetical protein INT45_001618 [Circinella minor]|uniref:Uncharacterized protein n=1 Tax=Circinella minor TaxID=1195481 RepID=A0A8H7S0D5_9FUNG|nr:hypothetical protein INT45_001618 [Circinella minor]
MSDLDKYLQNDLEEAVIAFSDRVRKEYLKRLDKQEKKKFVENPVCQKVYESDNIKLNHTDLSMGTVIKRYTAEFYEQYSHLDRNIQCAIMLGLNSILDLTGDKRIPPYQSHLFHSNDWKLLQKKFKRVFTKIDMFDNKTIIKKVSHIEKVVLGSVEKAYDEAAKAESNAHIATEADIFAIYYHVLEILQFSIQPDQQIASDDDDVMKWPRVIETVFRRGNLRCEWQKIKTGNLELQIKSKIERTSDTTQSDGSAATDKIKLLITSKLILDHLLATTENQDDIAVPALHLCGHEIKLISLRLAADGVYVAVMEGFSRFPRSATDLHVLRKIINILYKFKVNILYYLHVILNPSYINSLG